MCLWNRSICAMAAALAFFAASSAASSEEYPTKPVRIVVGFGPGASSDIIARVLQPHLTQKLGQPFIIENKPGAGSTLAAEYVARQPKDGYTLLMCTIANAINTTVSPNPNFDFARNLDPVVLAASLPNILVVHPALGVSNVKELIALANSKPGQIHFGSAGVGTSLHLSGELFNQMAGIELVHVPYQDSVKVLTDLLPGRIQVFFSPASSVLGHIEQGKLTALATTQATRSAALPNLPTMAEAALPGFDTGIWFGLVAPAGVPKEIAEKLAAAANEALRKPDVIAMLKAQGFDAIGGTPEEFGRYIEAETKKWAAVAKKARL